MKYHWSCAKRVLVGPMSPSSPIKETLTWKLDDLPKIARNIIDSCLSNSFCVYLSGPVGVGKSALVREILYQLGVPRNQPVQSPTFTYANDYTDGVKRWMHIDLYRVPTGLEIDDLVGERTIDGYFVEWSELAPTFLAPLPPTHRFELGFAEDAAIGACGSSGEV